jgi:hypothetical protein
VRTFNILILLLFVLCNPCTAQHSPPDIKDYEQLFKLMKRKDDVGERAYQGWLEFSTKRHSKEEQALLVQLWNKYTDDYYREVILYAARRDHTPALNKIRDDQIKNPQNDNLLAICLENLGLYVPHTRSPSLVAYFTHKSPSVCIGAVSAFLTILERFDGLRIGEGFVPGKRSPEIFKNFVPHLKKLLKSEHGNLRAGGLRGLVMLSPSPSKMPLDLLRSMARDNAYEVRYCIARVAQRNPRIDLTAELIILLGDEHLLTTCFANLALELRLGNNKSRQERDAIIKQIEEDLAKEDSCAIKAPHILRRLGDIRAAANDAESALKYFRDAGLSSAKAKFEPPHFGYSAGATARVQAALILISRGENDKAKIELVKAHLDFHPECDIQIPGQNPKALHLVLKKLAKMLGGIKFPVKFVKGPPTKFGKVSAPKANPNRVKAKTPPAKPSSQPSKRSKSRPGTSQPVKKKTGN